MAWINVVIKVCWGRLVMLSERKKDLHFSCLDHTNNARLTLAAVTSSDDQFCYRDNGRPHELFNFPKRGDRDGHMKFAERQQEPLDRLTDRRK